MRAVDRRLLRLGRATTVYLVKAVCLGTLRTGLLVAQAWLVATVVAGAFVSGKDLAEMELPMALLAAVVAMAALVSWSSESTAARCSASVKSSLRAALVQRLARIGRDGSTAGRSGELAALAVRGIDALDGYFARYVPQVFLAVIAPTTIVIAVFTVDWVSGAIMIVTLPLIPVFMALVGTATKAHNERQFLALQLLASHFLDVVSGLTTLKIFGRSRAQIEVVGKVTDAYRRRVLRTLRLAFLSSLILELLSSVSVALIAVGIGLRLLAGHADFRASLFVLLLAPEAYMPLRRLAADFHASAEGRGAAEQIFKVLDTEPHQPPTSTCVPDPAKAVLSLQSLGFTYPGRDRPAIEGVTLEVRPGEVVALTGPSGCGKTTLIGCLLGFIQPDAGRVLIDDVDLRNLDPDVWRERVAWVPQRPHMFAATIGDNVRLGRQSASAADVDRAVTAARLDRLVSRLPRGLSTSIGEGGARLSAGERQRIALARAFVRDAPVLLLDEPTANLDGETEMEVLDAVRDLSRGRTVLIVAHRPALLQIADRVVDLSRMMVPA